MIMSIRSLSKHQESSKSRDYIYVLYLNYIDT